MATGKQIVRFDDFSGGEYGANDLRHAAHNSFDGLNMMVYANGSIGPRPGFKNLGITGLPAAPIAGIALTPTPNREILIIAGNKAYYAPLSGGAATAYTGTFAGTISVGVYPRQDTTAFYVAVPGDKVYKIDPVAGTLTGIAGSPGGHDLAIYGQQMVVATTSGSSATNRIKWSALSDFTTWGAADFLDVGDNWQVTSLREQQNHLTVFKRDGIYVITGVLGSGNEVVRKVADGKGVLHPWHTDIDEAGRIWFQPLFRTHPASFDGASVRHLQYLSGEVSIVRDDDAGTAPPKNCITAFVGDQTPGSIILSTFTEMLLFHNGIWTAHYVDFGVGQPLGMVRANENGVVIATDGSSTSPAVYGLQVAINRPGSETGDTWAKPGDNSNTPLLAYFQLADWWAPDGTDVAVRKITVDYFRFTDYASDDIGFEVTPNVLGVDGGNDALSTQSTYVPSSADYGRDRKVFTFEEVWGSGFNVFLNNIKGCAIEAVIVELSTRPTTPRS